MNDITRLNVEIFTSEPMPEGRFKTLLRGGAVCGKYIRLVFYTSTGYKYAVCRVKEYTGPKLVSIKNTMYLKPEDGEDVMVYGTIFNWKEKTPVVHALYKADQLMEPAYIGLK